MALTLESLQRLEKVGLSALYDSKKARWETMVKKTHAFVKANFPDGVEIRVDDVAKALVPLLEVDKELTKHLAAKKLKQKYWVQDFGDLILDKAKSREWWT